MDQRFIDLLDDVVLGTASADDMAALHKAAQSDPELAAALAECEAIYASLSDVLPIQAPPLSVRSRLMDSTASDNRFARFASSVARLLDVAVETAERMLAGIDRATNWGPSPWGGIELYHLEGGPVAANAVAGFVRMAPGVEFPHHEHFGDEVILVVQGHCTDSEGRQYRTGDEVRMAAGTDHHFKVDDDSPVFIQLAIVQDGIRVGEMELRAGDPNI